MPSQLLCGQRVRDGTGRKPAPLGEPANDWGRRGIVTSLANRQTRPRLRFRCYPSVASETNRTPSLPTANHHTSVRWSMNRPICTRTGRPRHEPRPVDGDPEPIGMDIGRVRCDSSGQQGRTRRIDPSSTTPTKTPFPACREGVGRGTASVVPDSGVAVAFAELIRYSRFRSRISVTLPRGTTSVPEPHECDRLKHVGRLEEGQIAKAVRNGEGGAMRGWNPATRNPDNWRWTTTGFLV